MNLVAQYFFVYLVRNSETVAFFDSITPACDRCGVKGGCEGISEKKI